MLTEEEERRLESFFVSDLELLEDHTRGPEFYTNAVKWLADRLKDTNDDCKLKDVEFSIVVSQYCTEILDLKKQLEIITKERDGLQQQYTSDVYKNPDNEISDRFYPR